MQCAARAISCASMTSDKSSNRRSHSQVSEACHTRNLILPAMHESNPRFSGGEGEGESRFPWQGKCLLPYRLDLGCSLGVWLEPLEPGKSERVYMSNPISAPLTCRFISWKTIQCMSSAWVGFDTIHRSLQELVATQPQTHNQTPKRTLRSAAGVRCS